MSLAMYASPIEDSYTEPNNYINQKRQQIHNKTQKSPSRENFDTAKVNSILEKIHHSTGDSDDEEEHFLPPDKPQSMGVERTIPREHMSTMSNNQINPLPKPLYSETDNLDVNYYHPSPEIEKLSGEEYYKKVLPAYLQNINSKNISAKGYGEKNDVLLQKINYMIHLLEKTQDERTNNVTEEVILYSFLGIFIIFIVDSFARVGKYVR
jgi:hypothetical protein